MLFVYFLDCRLHDDRLEVITDPHFIHHYVTLQKKSNLSSISLGISLVLLVRY